MTDSLWIMADNGRSWEFVQGTPAEIQARIDSMTSQGQTVLTCRRPGTRETVHEPRRQTGVTVDYTAHTEQLRQAMDAHGIAPQPVTEPLLEPVGEREAQLIQAVKESGIVW